MANPPFVFTTLTQVPAHGRSESPKVSCIWIGRNYELFSVSITGVILLVVGLDNNSIFFHWLRTLKTHQRYLSSIHSTLPTHYGGHNELGLLLFLEPGQRRNFGPLVHFKLPESMPFELKVELGNEYLLQHPRICESSGIEDAGIRDGGGRLMSLPLHKVLMADRAAKPVFTINAPVILASSPGARVLLRLQGKQHTAGHVVTHRTWSHPGPSPLRSSITAPAPEVEHDPAPLAVVSTDAAPVHILAPVPVVLVEKPPVALTRSALILARLSDDTDSDSSSDYTNSDDNDKTGVCLSGASNVLAANSKSKTRVPCLFGGDESRCFDKARRSFNNRKQIDLIVDNKYNGVYGPEQMTSTVLTMYMVDLGLVNPSGRNGNRPNELYKHD
ncbi:hypothetical protein FB451DRAFT_1365488 [Mycena latifolia]|nr:hypothetical protein FB451DRAFT_1365488 [Mycena latifolia]